MTRLQYLREEQGMSLRELARRSGVGASMISRIESGQRDIGRMEARTVVKLASALDSMVEDLLA